MKTSGSVSPEDHSPRRSMVATQSLAVTLYSTCRSRENCTASTRPRLSKNQVLSVWMTG